MGNDNFICCISTCFIIILFFSLRFACLEKGNYYILGYRYILKGDSSSCFNFSELDSEMENKGASSKRVNLIKKYRKKGGKY